MTSKIYKVYTTCMTHGVYNIAVKSIYKLEPKPIAIV